MRESVYQGKLIKKLLKRFPDCVILKNDAAQIQGVPDLTVFHGDRWGMLEVKESRDAPEQPNQGFYVKKMDDMSFAAFIFPENEAEVLDDLQHALCDRRKARVS